MLFLLIIFYISIPLFIQPDNTAKADKALQDWIDSVKKMNIPEEPQHDTLFYFDPNTAKISELEKLGIKGDALINLLKLRESGLKFIQPEDILKVHSLDTVLAKTLMGYIKTDNSLPRKSYGKKSVPADFRPGGQASKPPTTVQKDTTKHIKNKRPPLAIEINSADSAEFSLLKGIGPVLSARIVAYRKALGGFFSAAQLKEVYGMPEETVNENLPRLTVDTTKVRTININKASLRQLKAHPYISFYAAKAIVEYRKNNYPVKNINEILSLKEIKNKHRKYLKKYLTVE
jgi:competence ComEA-like helix-hairpin-helix protein